MVLPLMAAAVFLAPLCPLPALAEQASREYLDHVHTEIKAHHYHEAMKLLKVKADRGCAYSQSLLGLMHQKGLGCKADAREAAHWFTMAARRDFVDAQFQLGKLYRTASRELAPQTGEAKYWLTKASAGGVSEARQLIDRVPGGEELAYKVSQFRNQASSDASASEQGLVQAWTGYSNIVGTLNAAAVNKTGNN
jgi:TPR repeat protein